MHNHKIFDVLKSFDSKRLKRFADFLNSPYPKKSPKAVSLGVRLTAFYPDFDAGKLDEELAYKAFESQKAFSKHELVRYLSLLLTLAEDFIAIESLEKSSYLKGSLITEYYYETKNDAGLKRTIKQNEKKLNTTLFIDSTNYFYSYLNQKASFNYSWQLKNGDKARSEVKNSIEALNHHFIIQLFRAAISFYSCHNRRPKEGEVLLLDAVLKEVGGNLLQVKPLVALWYYACQLTFNPLDLHLAEELKYALLQHTGTIPPFDGYTFIVILNNGLVQRLGHSRQKYLQERYDLYQIEIAEGWLAADGVIGNAIFNNIIIASLALGKIADAEVFLEKYKENLLPGIREEIILYNRARIAFAKNGFQESLRLAQRVNYLNHSIALGIKRIQMMCFIELNDLAQAQHIWNSMNMYIFRLEDAGKSLKVRNSQFLKVTKLLMKEGWVKKKEKYRDQIIEIIAASPLMPEVEWIESRLKNL